MDRINNSKDLSSSDDEIFISKGFNFKEIKCRLFRRTTGFVDSDKESPKKLNESFKIIEARSEPNLSRDVPEKKYPKHISHPNLSCRDSFSYKTWDSHVSDESFVKMEKEIEAYLQINDEMAAGDATSKIDCKTDYVQDGNLNNEVTSETDSITSKVLGEHNRLQSPKINSQKSYIFKTPAPPLKFSKVTPSKTENSLTPTKNDTKFKSVCSPVAYYITNSPQPTLVKNVQPKKPLPTYSHIPKLITGSCSKKEKENFELPQKAYIQAKETKQVEVAGPGHLPSNCRVKQMTSSLRKVFVTKHQAREGQTSAVKKEDASFDDLPLSQADVSVCTVKTGYKTTLT